MPDTIDLRLKQRNSEFSFIILTLNEERHLPRLLESVKGLNARVYVVDSGSSDGTLDICRDNQIPSIYNLFENHPKQWHIALTAFEIETPWVICLDADQIVSSELHRLLADFKDVNFKDFSGIYFNRKNYFRGKWIRFGGYYPKYLLKMFRYKNGYSDLNENMDHRFVVNGKTTRWKAGHLLEENLKESEISFWIQKHDKYSDQLAEEEIERMLALREQTIKPYLFGSPDERIAYLKNLWWKMPLYIRPILYLIFRLFIQGGIFDGKTGTVFHFLQGFWFRLIVDIKIEEKLKSLDLSYGNNNAVAKFILSLLSIYFLIHGSHILFIGLITPGGMYNDYLAKHLNYIAAWRECSISITAFVLRTLDFRVSTTQTALKVTGRAGFVLIYSCLGYKIMSVFTAFVLAFPKKFKPKIVFLVLGLISIQSLNIFRLILVALYSTHRSSLSILNHHLLFNLTVYLLIGSSIYLWTNSNERNGYRYS